MLELYVYLVDFPYLLKPLFVFVAQVVLWVCRHLYFIDVNHGHGVLGCVCVHGGDGAFVHLEQERV